MQLTSMESANHHNVYFKCLTIFMCQLDLSKTEIKKRKKKRSGRVKIGRANLCALPLTTASLGATDQGDFVIFPKPAAGQAEVS